MGRVRDSAVVRRLPTWLRGREGDLWLMLTVLVIGVVTVVGLQAVATAMQRPAVSTANQSGAPSLPHGVYQAHERVYRFSQQNPGLMNPAADARGRIWVGEMAENKLAMLDPHTGAVEAWTPPGGQYNIMQTLVDQRGDVWFSEEAANYIGQFDPNTHTFRTYPLGQINGQGVGPEAMAFDPHGDIWFTEVTGGALGRLDPTSGAIATFPLPAGPGGAPAYPYTLAVTPDETVWFGDLSGGVVGKLDPTTGAVTPLSVGDPKAQVYSMAVGPDGGVWFTELLTDRIGRIDPPSGKVTVLTVPSTLGNPATLYSVVTRGADLWFTSTGANALVRYTPATQQFAFYQLATPASTPFGLTAGPDRGLWFTADGAPNYIGYLRP